MDVLWILLTAAAGLMGVSVGLYTGTTLLRRTMRDLQYGLADLEERLVREVKKRAAGARWEEEPSTDKLVEDLKGMLSPSEFVKRKWGRRLNRGTPGGQTPGQSS